MTAELKIQQVPLVAVPMNRMASVAMYLDAIVGWAGPGRPKWADYLHERVLRCHAPNQDYAWFMILPEHQGDELLMSFLLALQSGDFDMAERIARDAKWLEVQS